MRNVPDCEGDDCIFILSHDRDEAAITLVRNELLNRQRRGITLVFASANYIVCWSPLAINAHEENLSLEGFL
jgi:L-rhamnose isomerase